MTEPKTVYQRIAEASAIIAETTFTKSGTVNAGTKNSYGFIPIGQLLAAVRKAHAKAGLFVMFSEPKFSEANHESRYTVEKTSPYDNGKKTLWTYANGHIDVLIYGADGDCIETSVSCEACDNSDKLDNKLLTNAQRSLYRSLYAVDEGSPDPEEVNVENVAATKPAEPKPAVKRPTYDPKLRAELNEKIESMCEDFPGLAEKLQSVVISQFGVFSVRDLKVPQLEECVKIAETYIKEGVQ